MLIIYAAHPAYLLWSLNRVRLDGNAPPERLELAGLSANFPSTSPGSDRLAFEQYDTNWDIWRVRPDGVSTPVVRGSFGDRSPDLSPDGQRLAFTSNRNGESTEVWVVNLDSTTAPVQLTHGPGPNQGSARWSPDGQWIVFDSADATGQQDIYVIASSGGQARRITFEPSNENLPSWSRDGQWIYFASTRTGRSEIWRCPFPGGARDQWQRMTTGGAYYGLESTDGGTLFYSVQKSVGSKSTRELFAKPLAGGPEKGLANDLVQLSFAVAGDGIYLWGRPSPTDGQFPLLLFDPASRTSRPVTRSALVPRLPVCVSPDGQSLFFAVEGRGERDLKLIEHFR